jgi:hypothetical protein
VRKRAIQQSVCPFVHVQIVWLSSCECQLGGFNFGTAPVVFAVTPTANPEIETNAPNAGENYSASDQRPTSDNRPTTKSQ